jgi:hypothetical protein
VLSFGFFALSLAISARSHILEMAKFFAINELSGVVFAESIGCPIICIGGDMRPNKNTLQFAFVRGHHLLAGWRRTPNPPRSAWPAWGSAWREVACRRMPADAAIANQGRGSYQGRFCPPDFAEEPEMKRCVVCKNLFVFMIVCTGIGASTASAELISNWNFSGLTAKTGSADGTLISSTAGNPGSNATISDLKGSVTLTYTIATPGNGNGQTVGAVINELNLAGWGTTNYIEFTLMANSGYSLDLSKISISGYRNGPGAPDEWRFQVDSGSGFNQFGSVQSVSSNGISIFTTYDFTDSVTGVSSATIRFAPSSGTGNLHINGLTVEGGVVVVPEPGTLLLSCVAVTGMLIRRRAIVKSCVQRS